MMKMEPSGMVGGSILEPAEGEECSRSAVSGGTSTTSSIGNNSDDDGEVQSAFNGDDGGALSSMQALEEVLPIRRGISKFYNGKSKSYACLGEVSSMKDIGKAENAYNRKRRNGMAYEVWEKSLHQKQRNGRIAKREISKSRSTLALAVAMSSSECLSETSDDSNLTLFSKNSSSNLCSMPKENGEIRSFSVADLQSCVSNSFKCMQFNKD